MARWLEISADYRCNNRCLGCFSVQDTGPSMDAREIVAMLARGRREGADALWLGGGEPTLRKDLFAIVRRAREVGYRTVRLQTNGMLLAYPEFVRRCVDAGITEVSVSIKGATAEMHDALAGTPGCHALMETGIANARDAGLGLEGDVLVYKRNMAALPEIARHYTSMGLTRLYLWTLSSVDHGAREVVDQVPRVSELVPHVMAAMDALGPNARADAITALHIPACALPASHHRALFFAPDLELLVGNPGGHVFRLEDSPIEGGHFLPRCAPCAHRARCNGLRADYLALYGDREFQPVVVGSPNDPHAR